MEIVPLPDSEAVAATAAAIVERQVRGRPDTVLGVATGATPVPTYRELVRGRTERGVDYGGVRVFLLDEYVGLPPGHPQSYRATIARELTDALGIPDDRVLGPDPALLPGAGEVFERQIADAGGIDLQLLGIGTDGHLAFNEPGSSFDSRTRLTTLTETTRRDNARYFDGPDSVPKLVLTQGLGTISEARHLVLIATGERKAPAVAAAVEGPLGAHSPASVLQLHPHVTVLLDPAAAAGLARLDHYAETLAAKPEWQGF